MWFESGGGARGAHRYDPSAALRARGKTITDFKSAAGQQ
jgi:hypothetical protein